MGVPDYSTTPASNSAINGIGILGTNSPANFDNAMRQLMADIATARTDGAMASMPYATKSSGYTLAATDRGKLIDCTAAVEIELLAVATAGAGFYFIAKANGGAVTLDPNASENINGSSSSLVVANGTSAIVACDGTAWYAIIMLSSQSSATTTASGAVELATDAEAITKADTARAITPSNLAALGSSATFAGFVELATDAEAIARADTARAVTPANLAAVTSVDAISGMILVPADKSYKLVVKAPFGGTINETVTICASGTCTATFKINTTALGGTANAVSSVEQTQAQASNNVFVAGDDIVVTISSNSTCLDMSFTIKFTRVI